MKYLRQLWSRLVDWRKRQAPPPVPAIPHFVSVQPTLARDVSAAGVRFFSLCAACGCRLESSATLCEDCAHRRSREPWA